MAKPMKTGIQVQWINITYRSVVSITLAAALVITAGAGYWYYRNYVAPKGDAETAIARAGQRLGEAAALPIEGRQNEALAAARVALHEARQEFDGRSYREATVAAIRSETLSLKLIAKIGGAEADTRIVRFNRIDGDVRVKQAGEFSWKSANTKMVLRIGDQVKTSSSGMAEVLYFDGTKTKIQPGSLLEIRDLYEDPVTKVRRVKEKLSWGEVRASTQRRNVSGSFHEVATEKVAARSEESGEFRIAFDKKKQTSEIDLYEGRLELSAGGKKETLNSGERITARADGRLSNKQRLPGIVRLLAPSDQRVFISENPEDQTLTLNWEAVAGSSHYRLVISENDSFTAKLFDKDHEGVRAVLPGLPRATYHWKVAAVSKSGVLGPFSPAWSFRVSSQRIRDRTDSEPPKLEITEFVPVGQMVIINGRTEPGATLWVDNSKVEVYEDGSFNAVVRLRREGLNELLLLAQDTAGNETKLSRSAYIEGY